MSDLIKNMIAQIANKNFKGAQSAFEDVMTSKIGNAFDLEKVKLEEYIKKIDYIDPKTVHIKEIELPE